MSKPISKSSSGFGMFIIGATIGSVAALLFAPKSGRELRSDIKDQAGKTRDKAMETTKTMAEKTAQATDRARNRLKSQIDQVADTVEKTEQSKSRQLSTKPKP